jgi:ABC-type transport system substrate-binding protein
MRKLISSVLALALVLSLVACNSSPNNANGGSQPASTSAQQSVTPSNTTASSADKGEHKIIIGLSADPQTFEPWGMFNNGRRQCMPMTYQPLVTITPDLESGKMVTNYVLASGYEKVDPKTYEIKIRKGIKDTAGNDFTAADAVFCYQTAKDKGTFVQLKAISSFELVDDYTFRMVASRSLAVGDIEDILISFNMVTKKSYEASKDGMATTPVGTTGYILTEYVPGSKVVYTKANSYWNDAANKSKSVEDGYCSVYDTTNLDSVQFEIITDATTMTVALQTGKIDFSTNVQANDVKRFGEDKSKFNVFSYPENMYEVAFNADSKSPTTNLNLRKALAYAIDSQGILDAAFNGSGLLTHAWAYPTYLDYQKKWDSTFPFPYDTKLAKEYLQKYFDETGTKASDLHLKLLTMNRLAMKKTAEAIQAYVVELIGNPTCVEILSYDQAQYNSLRLDPTQFDLLVNYTQSINRSYCTFAWNNYANTKKNVNGNLFFDRSEKGQSLLEAAISEDTHSDATVDAYQQYVNENAFLKSLVCGNVYVAGESWIKNIKIGPSVSLDICGMEYDWSAKN